MTRILTLRRVLTLLLVSAVVGATAVRGVASEPAAGADLKIVDAMPDFFATWDADASKSDSERVSAFRTSVVAPHSELFVRMGSLDDREIATYLHDVASDVPAMRAYAAAMPERISAELSRFTARFPDFVPNVTIELMPSLYHFDGQVRFSQTGTIAIAFGIDTFARAIAPRRNNSHSKSITSSFTRTTPSAKSPWRAIDSRRACRSGSKCGSRVWLRSFRER